MDDIAFARSERRELFAILPGIASAHSWNKREVIRELERRCYSEEQIDAHLGDWADEQYEAMSALEKENGGFRFWEEETPGERL
jgi:hypothetical protein